MIVVTVEKNSITVDGHAGYAEAGKDIVCAAVSVLTSTLIMSLEEFTADRIIHVMHDGYVNIEIKNLSEQSKLLVDSFFIGICGIANEYPEYLTISPNGR